jgi:hypothetical protein
MAAVPSSRSLACVTLGMAGAMDLRLAARLAGSTGRVLTPAILDRRFLADYGLHLRQMIRLTEAQVLANGVTVPTIDLYRRLGVRVLLRGHGGELMHMHRAYAYSLDAAALALRDSRGLEGWVLRRLAAAVFEEPRLSFLTRSYRDLAAPAAAAAVKTLLEDTDGVAPLLHRLWLIFVGQYLPYTVGPSIVKFGTVVETRMPYVDADLIAALLAAAPTLKVGDRLQQHLLKSRAPRLLAIPDSNTGAPIVRPGRAWRCLGPPSAHWPSSGCRVFSLTSVWAYGCGARSASWWKTF